MIRGEHDDFAARQALPDKVIRLPDKFKGDARRQKSPEALPRASGKVHRKRIFRQAARPEFHHQLTGKFRPHRPVHSADVSAEFRLFPLFQQGLQCRQQMAAVVVVQRFLFKRGVKPASIPLCRMQDGGKVQMPGLVKIYGAVDGKQICPAYGFIQGTKPQGCQDFPRFLGHEAEVVDDVFRLAAEFGPQGRILRGDAYRARIFMAPAEHGAADGNQDGGSETEFLRPQQGGHHDVPPGAQLAVHLEPDAGTELVEHQRLLRFRQPQLPRQPGVLHAGERRGARSAVVAADHNHIRMGLHHACGNRANAHLGNKLDGDTGIRIGVAQVVN